MIKKKFNMIRFVFFLLCIVFMNKFLFSQTICVRAPVNISFIKYWGKRDEILNLPTKDSFGISLNEVFTETMVSIIDGERDEIIVLDDEEGNINKTKQGIQSYLDLFRFITGLSHRFRIQTQNHFPTASGLASSASGFSALAVGLVKVSGLDWSKEKVSALARQGSGSAARAVCGGFVRFYKGDKEDGSDSFAETVFEPEHWPELRMIVVITTKHSKSLSSRDSARILVQNPLYFKWSESSHKRVDQAIEAVSTNDLKTLGNLMEQDWYELQQVLKTCNPAINYVTETTEKVIEKVSLLRSRGIECYFTTDAGPQVKIICLSSDVLHICEELQKIENVIQLIPCNISSGAYDNCQFIDNSKVLNLFYAIRFVKIDTLLPLKTYPNIACKNKHIQQ